MSNREFPMMPWFPQDFAGATAGWTFVERSLYRCLLDVQWVQGKLPTDPIRLALICGISTADFNLAWPQVSIKFVNIDGSFINVRLEEHREKSRKYHDQKVLAGQASAAKRTLNGRSTYVPTQVQHPSPSPSPSPSPEEDNGSTSTKKKNTKKLKTRFPENFILSADLSGYVQSKIPDADPVQLFESFRGKAQAKGWEYVSWPQAFQEFVRNAMPASGHFSAGHYPRKQSTDQFAGMKWT